MKVNVFDTHVRTRDGRYLHFDVLIDGNDQARATQYARDWMAERGVRLVLDFVPNHVAPDHEWARTAEDVLWRRSKLGLQMDTAQAARLQAWMDSHCR